MPDRSPSADRKRRYRERQRRGERAYSVTIPDAALVDMIEAGWITDDDAGDREKVAALIREQSLEWVERWRCEFSGTRPVAARNPSIWSLRNPRR